VIGRLLVAAVLASTPAYADEAEVRPWAKDVPEPKQREAEKLFDEGNDLFAKQAHAPAMEKYRAALALWDHPLIQFNMAVTLIRLDRTLEAAEALEKALRYRETPFKPELYQQALDYQAVLKNTLGFVEVSCDQSGASITLDGKAWFNCPDTQKVRVPVGEHTIVGDKAKYLPVNRRLVVAGGATVTERIELEPLETAIKLEYPYKRWIPWTVTAGGAAIGLAGLGVWLAGRGQMNSFKQNFDRDCAMGCEKDLSEHPALRDQRDSAELKGTIGIAMMVAGGATAVGGFVFAMVFNQPKRILPNVEVNVTAGGARATYEWRF
jgi:tetratricopeptide (TPR) repeat protein